MMPVTIRKAIEIKASAAHVWHFVGTEAGLRRWWGVNISYSNHDWRLTTALIRGILEATGIFKVEVSTAPEAKDAPGWDTWRPRFSDHDVVIQTCNDLGGGPPWPR
ncbi:MAG: hypothetical protein ABUL61_05645, partial [Oleiharenicola lentus]